MLTLCAAKSFKQFKRFFLDRYSILSPSFPHLLYLTQISDPTPLIRTLPRVIGDLRVVSLHITPEISITKLSSIDREGTTVIVVYMQKQSDWIKFSILPCG